MMEKIRSLKPRVTREQAIESFAPPGPVGFLRTALAGPLVGVADFYIPFRLFEITIENNRSRQSKFAAVDRVTGLLDLYSFEFPPDDLIEMETRNRPEVWLGDDECSRLVIDKFRRIVFSQGFFRLRDFNLRANALPYDLHIPYWVGFRGHEALHVSVMDAVRRRMEGAKVRQLLKSWILTQPSNSLPPETGYQAPPHSPQKLTRDQAITTVLR